MAWRRGIPRLRLHHPSRRKFLEHIAATSFVTPERMLEVIRLRLEYRRGRMFRQRSRKRTLQENVNARIVKKMPTRGRAGEGALHAHLRAAGISAAEFCRIADIAPPTFSGWFGHCMYGWPVALLKLWGHNRNMAAKLRELNFDPRQFELKLDETPNRSGRYAKAAGQLVYERPKDAPPLLPPKNEWNPWNRS